MYHMQDVSVQKCITCKMCHVPKCIAYEMYHVQKCIAYKMYYAQYISHARCITCITKM